MKIIFGKKFLKRYVKLRESEKKKFKERRNLFIQDPQNQILKNYTLHGKYKGMKSINITGDLRVVYEMIDENTAMFIDIDTHSNLYS